jgi:hypothetical protein
MTTPELTLLQRRAIDLLWQSISTENDDRARELAQQSAEALIDVAREAWGKRLELASSLLDRAGEHLDAAEAEPNPQKRQKQLDLFEHYMSAAEAAKSNARPGPRMH